MRNALMLGVKSIAQIAAFCGAAYVFGYFNAMGSRHFLMSHLVKSFAEKKR